MNRFEYPEEDRIATLAGFETRDIAYCCSIFDNCTSIQYQVFRDMGNTRRFVVEGGGNGYEYVDTDMDSVFNYIVNQDNCEHEFYFDFVRFGVNKDYATHQSNVWLVAFDEWRNWILRGRKEE